MKIEQEREPVLEVRRVCAGYGRGRKYRRILTDVDFCLYKGEILGLVGESGCGKSTLSKTILGFVPVESGQVIHHTSRPQMVFQDPFSSLNPGKKVGWILEEPLRMQKIPAAARREKAEAMLLKVGLDKSFLNRRPGDLSGGQRQRVSIAISLIQGSRLILADEPVSALDVTIQRQIMELMLALQEELGLSYLFISHDLDVIYQMCDRVMVMQKGQVVEEGDVERIFEEPRHPYTRSLLAASLSYRL